MTRLTLYKIAFFLSIVTSTTGLAAKIMHFPGGLILILLSALFSIVYVMIALYEIYKSDRITLDEKLMWTAGFILGCTVAGLFYLVIGRPRILSEFEILNQHSE